MASLRTRSRTWTDRGDQLLSFWAADHRAVTAFSRGLMMIQRGQPVPLQAASLFHQPRGERGTGGGTMNTSALLLARYLLSELPRPSVGISNDNEPDHAEDLSAGFGDAAVDRKTWCWPPSTPAEAAMAGSGAHSRRSRVPATKRVLSPGGGEGHLQRPACACGGGRRGWAAICLRVTSPSAGWRDYADTASGVPARRGGRPSP